MDKGLEKSATGTVRAVFYSVLTLGFAVRLFFLLRDDGIFWPDEIYQGLEQAHRLAFGYGLVGWEYIVGARPWTFPALMAPLLRIGTSLGNAPENYLFTVRFFFCLVSLGTALGIHRLAKNLGADDLSATLGMAFFFLAPPVVFFSPRTMAETAGAFFVVWSLAHFFSPSPSRYRNLWASSLIAFSVFIRIHHAIYGLLFAVFLAWKRRWKDLLQSLGILILWAIIYGFLDFCGWGEWFHSALTYLKANIMEDKSRNFGTSPFWYYADVFWTSMPLSTLLLLASAALLGKKAGNRNSIAVLAMALAFIGVHSAIPHKEFRFIFSAIPLLGASIGASFSRMKESRISYAGLAIAVVSLAFFPSLTFEDLGAQKTAKAEFTSAFDYQGPLNRLLITAGKRPDLCGILVEKVPLEWTGGYSYLHRNVPLYSTRYKFPREEVYYNYILAERSAKPSEEEVAGDQGWRLLKTAATCRQDTDYDAKIP